MRLECVWRDLPVPYGTLRRLEYIAYPQNWMRRMDVLFLARCARSRQRRGEDFYVFAFLYVTDEQIFVFLRVQRSRRHIAGSFLNLHVNEIEIVIPKSAHKTIFEFIERLRSKHVSDAASSRDGGQISLSCRRRRRAAGRLIAFIVKDDVNEVLRTLIRDGCQAAEIEQQR